MFQLGRQTARLSSTKLEDQLCFQRIFLLCADRKSSFWDPRARDGFNYERIGPMQTTALWLYFPGRLVELSAVTGGQ